MRTTRVITGALLAAALVVGWSGPTVAVNGGACGRAYHPALSASDFASPTGSPNAIDNPYFPLEPGTTWVYEGFKEGESLRDVMTMTGDNKTIMGVTITVVRDTAFQGGVLAEDTFDFYAQDDAGNVWYFGEDTREFDAQGNVVTTEGSWEAGVNGNLPGILMLAHPKSGQTYRQEYGVGVAIDMSTVLSVHRHKTVPYGSFGKVVETKEFSCIEGGIDHKWYAPGIGNIKELAVANGQEMIQLVSVTH